MKETNPLKKLGILRKRNKYVLEGDLDLINTPIKELLNNLSVEVSLDLINTQIEITDELRKKYKK